MLFLPGKVFKASSKKPVEINRVVSLSPSITRQIVDLGAENLLVGVTSYHPPLKKKVAIIGSMIQPNAELILQLQPDLVVASRHDNKIQFNEQITTVGLNIHDFSRNDTFLKICNNYLKLGKLLDKQRTAKRNVVEYTTVLKQRRKIKRSYKIAMFISHSPIMAISNASFLGKAIAETGSVNVFKAAKSEYPLISLEHIVLLNPDVIISIMHDAIKGDKNFKNIFKRFPKMRVHRNNSFYTIPADAVCYYTPRVYLAIVKHIQDILLKEERSLAKKS